MMGKTAITLFVAWQDPIKRSIRVVGRLRRYHEGDRAVYEFAYVNEVERAQEENGFRPFLAFPEADLVYRSEALFPFFTNRVIPATRRDYLEHIEELGLAPEEASPVTILARGGGRRATDHVEVFAPPLLNPDTGMHEMFFLLRGVRHMPRGTEECIEALAPRDRLFCMLDFQNPHNPRAVALRTEELRILGYMPDYAVADVDALRQAGAALEVFVERVNPSPAPRHHRLLCRLQARWPADRMPFSDERFQPLATRGTARHAAAVHG